MSKLQLVKNQACRCGSEEFIHSPRGSHCKQCQAYFPNELKRSTTNLMNNLENLKSLNVRLRGMIDELEELVKE